MRTASYGAAVATFLILWQSTVFAAEAPVQELAPGEVEARHSPDAAAIIPSVAPHHGQQGHEEHHHTPDDASLKHIDISLTSLVAAGYTSAGPEAAQALQAGAHDPKQRGFTVQNVELSVLGTVDRFFSAEAHLLFQISPEGESVFELEEAFATTEFLPWGFQVKAGTYFTEFGRLNTQHPHLWDFVDQPIISSRLLGGDGLRNPGARVSWVSPLPWHSELLVGVQNAQGETAVSFLGEPDTTDFAGFALQQPPSQKPLLTSRWLNRGSPTEAWAFTLGASAAVGPNPTGRNAQTYLGGADFTAKWQAAPEHEAGSFLSLQAEALARRYELLDSSRALNDWGGYVQAAWGINHGWVIAVRYDHADGDGPVVRDSIALDQQRRGSTNVTFNPTEYSRVRLQYNYARSDALVRKFAQAVWLQFEFLLGAHPRHAP